MLEKVFLEILQNSQENTCARVSFQADACSFIKKETLSFPVNFAKSLKPPFLQNTSGRLPLKNAASKIIDWVLNTHA